MRIKRFLTILLSILFIAILLGVLPACTAKRSENIDAVPDPDENPASDLDNDSEPEGKSGPKYVAHKGYSKYYLGNTESAFLAAARKGFYGIETDIRKTKDGHYVCNHDATVRYADNTEKRISSSTLEELLAAPIENNTTDNDEYLCTFETYLRACKAGNKVAVIELKDYFGKSDIQSILDIIDAEYDREKVSFITFIYALLPIVRHEDPDIDLQYLSQTEDDPNIDRCLSSDISIDVKYTILTEEMVQSFHAAGLTVNVWTVNETSILSTAKRLGVDYVTTDVFHEN